MEISLRLYYDNAGSLKLFHLLTDRNPHPASPLYTPNAFVPQSRDSKPPYCALAFPGSFVNTPLLSCTNYILPLRYVNLVLSYTDALTTEAPFNVLWSTLAPDLSYTYTFMHASVPCPDSQLRLCHRIRYSVYLASLHPVLPKV